MTDRSRKRPGRRWLTVLLVVAFIAAVYVVLLTAVDMPAFAWWHGRKLSGQLKHSVYFFRGYLQAVPLALLGLSILLTDGRRFLKVAAVAALSMALTSIPVWALKLTIMRTRPRWFDGQSWRASFVGFWPGRSQFVLQSLPSGDAAMAFALSMVLSWFYPRLRPVFLILAGGCGLSRFFLRYHFLSDVWLGAVIGVVMGSLTVRLAKRWGIRA